ATVHQHPHRGIPPAESLHQAQRPVPRATKPRGFRLTQSPTEFATSALTSVCTIGSSAPQLARPADWGLGLRTLRMLTHPPDPDDHHDTSRVLPGKLLQFSGFPESVHHLR